MYRGGDAARNMHVDTVPGSIKWVAVHAAAKRFFAQFAKLFVRQFGEDIALERHESWMRRAL
jgi:hypothetical protein